MIKMITKYKATGDCKSPTAERAQDELRQLGKGKPSLGPLG